MVSCTMSKDMIIIYTRVSYILEGEKKRKNIALGSMHVQILWEFNTPLFFFVSCYFSPTHYMPGKTNPISANHFHFSHGYFLMFGAK